MAVLVSQCMLFWTEIYQSLIYNCCVFGIVSVLLFFKTWCIVGWRNMLINRAKPDRLWETKICSPPVSEMSRINMNLFCFLLLKYPLPTRLVVRVINPMAFNSINEEEGDSCWHKQIYLVWAYVLQHLDTVIWNSIS